MGIQFYADGLQHKFQVLSFGFSLIIIISISIINSISAIINFLIMSSHQENPTGDQRTAQHDFLQQNIKNRFQVLAKLGSGAYGHVWKVRCKQTQQIYAIKKIFMAFDNQTDAQRVYRQINILRQVSHNNVVKLVQVLPSHGRKDIYLLFESLESDVFKAIKNRVLDQNHKKYIVYQLACALKYIHSASLLHRDLKPSNILINSSCQIKVCDFGLSRTTKSEFFNKAIMTEFVATRWYRSPEIIFGSKAYNSKSDMWSLGCLIYQLYSRRTLLPGENVVDQITKLLEFKGKPNQQEIDALNCPKAKDILQFFDIDRKPIDQYYDDLDNQEIKYVLDNLLAYDPNQRWSAEQLLQSEFLEQFRHSLPQHSSKHAIMLALNDNRKYKSQRYQESLMKGSQSTENRSKQKRQDKSLRNAKQIYSIHSNSLSKLIKQSLNSVSCRKKPFMHKKYQSAHASPSAQRNTQSLSKERNTQKRGIFSLIKRDKSMRSTISSFHLRPKENEFEMTKQRKKDKMDKNVKKDSISKHSTRDIYLLRKQKMESRRRDVKQNQENRMKMLKRVKVKYNQSIVDRP